MEVENFIKVFIYNDKQELLLGKSATAKIFEDQWDLPGCKINEDEDVLHEIMCGIRLQLGLYVKSSSSIRTILDNQTVNGIDVKTHLFAINVNDFESFDPKVCKKIESWHWFSKSQMPQDTFYDIIFDEGKLIA
tara:strand:- start:8757 stop:9158 length:402 start_codon:yes stop_codon:yes gene_type:complete